ncbi:MAG: hypothetical protein QOJ73_2462 [Streptosporangiaceae bacterium]|jgi:hypothetical protein|nr:hypothetical protein [Streptosporangiaceae bacterium]
MRGHVNAEALALCREGLLGRRRTARIEAHVSRCPRCAEVDARLGALPALLALTTTAPMPAELTARLNSVIAAEARDAGARTTGAPTTGAPTTGAPRAAEPVSGERRLWGRPAVTRKVLAFAAAAVVLVAGGGYVLSRWPSPSPSESSASSGAAPVTGPAARAGANAAAGDGGLAVISSGTDYRPGQLAAQVAVVLARYPIPAAGQLVPVPTRAASASAAQPRPVQQPSRLAALPGCVARIAAGLHPRMVDEARYNGRLATIIVLPATAPGPAQVWVVGPACSGSRSAIIAHVAMAGSG